jgi:selenocysteine-specific translation elongation factor
MVRQSSEASTLSDRGNVTVGVFGTDSHAKSAFESAIAKKSEAEGIVVYHRTEAGRSISLLDTVDYPDRIQGYSRIASICDHAFYLFPTKGALTPPDGELAVLLDAFDVKGTSILLDEVPSDLVKGSLRGTSVADFPIDARATTSSILDPSEINPRPSLPSEGSMIYVDRAFSVKGVGTVVLGFVLSGRVSVHDKLRPISGSSGATAEVRGVQINDEDFDSAERGIRVGLSLKGVEAKDLDKCHWMDDGSFRLTDQLNLKFKKSPYYKQDVQGRDMHLQLPGEMIPVKLVAAQGSTLAKLPTMVPVWHGMQVGIFDLNAKALRVAGGATCTF